MIDIIEKHPLEPFLPANARLLMLGSFPPPRARWSMDFYYPNLQNDMWRLYGLLFFGDKDYFLGEGKRAFDKERIVTFLNEKGIALFDTAVEIIRHKGNASDQFLEVVTPLDLKGLLQRIPSCAALVTTGQKATDTLLKQINAASPRVGGYSDFEQDGRLMRLYRMPSSSRAYPKPIGEKAEDYREMFHDLGML